jgi:hypothetical protein
MPEASDPPNEEAEDDPGSSGEQVMDIFYIYCNVFRVAKGKTTPLPAPLNQARGIDTMNDFY